MNDTVNFIEVPAKPLNFAERLRISLQTSARFFKDQPLPSLIFFAVYVAFIVWDLNAQRSGIGVNEPDLSQIPAFLKTFKEQMLAQSRMTWRGNLAGFVMILFWGNALLFIADRSEAFQERTVVGLVRYLIRGSMVGLLLILPVIVGLALLVVPGIFLAAVLVSAASICVFREESILKSIGHGFTLVSKGIAGQRRIFGFSLVFYHIIGAYAVSLTIGLMVDQAVSFFSHLWANRFAEHALAAEHVQYVVSQSFDALLNLSVTIFILRVFAEHLHLKPQEARESQDS